MRGATLATLAMEEGPLAMTGTMTAKALALAEEKEEEGLDVVIAPKKTARMEEDLVPGEEDAGGSEGEGETEVVEEEDLVEGIATTVNLEEGGDSVDETAMMVILEEEEEEVDETVTTVNLEEEGEDLVDETVTTVNLEEDLVDETAMTVNPVEAEEEVALVEEIAMMMGSLEEVEGFVAETARTEKEEMEKTDVSVNNSRLHAVVFTLTSTCTPPPPPPPPSFLPF